MRGLSVFPRCLALACVLAAGGCGDGDKAQPWDGEWTRRIEVPKGVAGRCIDETLKIDRGYWQLKAIVHATYHCNLPMTELVYEGVLGKVVIIRDTPTLDANITVDTLKLDQVANISRGEYDYLSSSGVEQLSEAYLGKMEQAQMSISIVGDSLATPVFEPLWTIAYSEAPYLDVLKTYTRAVAAEK